VHVAKRSEDSDQKIFKFCSIPSHHDDQRHHKNTQEEAQVVSPQRMEDYQHEKRHVKSTQSWRAS